MEIQFGIIMIFALASKAASAYKRVCFVYNSAQFRTSTGSFSPNKTDPSFCTHINYAFSGFDSSNILKLSDWDERGTYQQVLALRDKQPGLKVLITVGGWNFGMQQASNMMSTSSNRATFINSAISLCRSKGFDGIDIDFEFPASGQRGSPAGDKYLFTALLQEFRTAINNDASSSYGRVALLLTAEVGAFKVASDAAYEISTISQYVDWFNLMTYDMNGPWDSITGLNAPLYARPSESGVYYGGAERSTLNFDWGARNWVSKGAPKDKLVLGLALYGRCFTLSNAAQNGLGAPATGPCRSGYYTKEAGYLSHYEICAMLNQGAIRVYSNEQQAPYAYLDDQWVGYDDTVSLKAKLDYIKNNGFAGWIARTVDLDDFSGSLGCNAGPYPLMNFISSETTAWETTSTTSTSSTTSPTTSTTSTSSTTSQTTSTTSTSSTASRTLTSSYPLLSFMSTEIAEEDTTSVTSPSPATSQNENRHWLIPVIVLVSLFGVAALVIIIWRVVEYRKTKTPIIPLPLPIDQESETHTRYEEIRPNAGAANSLYTQLNEIDPHIQEEESDHETSPSPPNVYGTVPYAESNPVRYEELLTGERVGLYEEPYTPLNSEPPAIRDETSSSAHDYLTATYSRSNTYSNPEELTRERECKESYSSLKRRPPPKPPQIQMQRY